MEDDYFGKYTLSSDTIEKLKGIRETLQESAGSSNSAWRTLFHVEDDTDHFANPIEDVPMEIDNESSPKSQVPDDDGELPSTQFYFTQTKPRENNRSPSTRSTTKSISDIVKSLSETLEARCLDAEDMNGLTDANAVEIVENLSKRLSSKGAYNLCCSVCDMETGLGTYYARIVCSNLLFQKILQLEKNSNRIETSTITRMVEKFPDDVKEFLVVPLLNTNLKNTKVVLTLIKNYPPSIKKELISDFVEKVKELQPWHLTVLQCLINTQLDEDVKSGVLALLVDKALAYAEDKSYSQCILSFLKTQSPFTDDQRNMLHEMIIVHKTVFRKPMKNMFSKMFLHRDLWHMS
ncbi:uncharacterized protein LOC107037918 [Diachasma alloeum]|uniref:uncharacterized protein LOC107037918 n=1 Tax=Diachasma alloeum TaxID=454923 RepID=UPI00073846BF|nr:uncharacterized protein LOC107037918 [Diachasma alloeum]